MSQSVERSKRDKRLGLSFTQEEFDNLSRLAKNADKPTSVFAHEILTKYLDEHKDFIELIKKAEAAYQQSLRSNKDET
ncbi:MAG: hypothetical protein IJP61_07085 [Treponema sp.]|nr:hypothetical protein [Treponema sp.]